MAAAQKWFFFADFIAKASTNIPKIERALDNLVADDVLTVQTLKAETGRKLKFYEHAGAFKLRNDPLEQEVQDYVLEHETQPDGGGLYDYQILHKFSNANKRKIYKQMKIYEDLGRLKTRQMQLELPDKLFAWERAYATTCKFCAGT